MDLLTPSSPGVFQLCLYPLIAPGYLGEGCHASQPSDARTPWLEILLLLLLLLLPLLLPLPLLHLLPVADPGEAEGATAPPPIDPCNFW